MTESVLLIILLIVLAEVINSIKKIIARQPQISDDYFIFVLKPWVLIIYYAKSNVNIPFEFYIAENIER